MAKNLKMQKPSKIRLLSDTLKNGSSCLQCAKKNAIILEDNIIVHKVNGLICGTTSDQISRAIIKIGADKSLREKLGKNARKYAVQAVFQLFFTKGDINKILEEFSEFRINDYDDGKFQYDKRFFKKIVNGVCENNKYIFELIEENLAKEWPLERIDITMQSIISLALFVPISSIISLHTASVGFSLSSIPPCGICQKPLG